jgi:hypothetical protein
MALIAALRVKVTNTTGQMIRLGSVGFSYDTEGETPLGATLGADENLELDRELRDHGGGQQHPQRRQHARSSERGRSAARQPVPAGLAYWPHLHSRSSRYARTVPGTLPLSRRGRPRLRQAP